jgi:phenylacetic acid degradation operon negative regulatory protein
VLSIEKQILYLLSRSGGIMEARELVRIYEARGYSPQSVRNVLSGLKKDEYAASPRRSAYTITEKGLAFLRSVNQKPFIRQNEWNGSWLMVMLEIPETDRKKRDNLRSDLLQLGFGLLYKSVYISPWDHSARVRELLDLYGIDNAAAAIGSFLWEGITRERAKRIWPLESIRKLYEDKWRWFRDQFVPGVEAELALCGSAYPDPLKLFVHFLHLAEVTSELNLQDPMLPSALLPDDWPGYRALSEMMAFNRKLAGCIPCNSPYARFVRSSHENTQMRTTNLIKLPNGRDRL